MTTGPCVVMRYRRSHPRPGGHRSVLPQARDLPEPDVVEGASPFWYADTIRAWSARRPGNRGRLDPG